MYARFGKRILDLLLSSAALVLLSPLILVVALLVRMKLGRPIFFRQERPGLRGKPFNLVKFRTMTTDRDSSGALLPDRRRLTPFGKFLRRMSIDELPEMVNVLRGEMSLIGPRPLLVKYMPYFDPSEMTRFQVLPGITGWAQIHGRNGATWDERLKMDVWYVENISFKLDLAILAATLRNVVLGKDVEVDPRSVMLDLDEERKQHVSTGAV